MVFGVFMVRDEMDTSPFIRMTLEGEGCIPHDEAEEYASLVIGSTD